MTPASLKITRILAACTAASSLSGCTYPVTSPDNNANPRSCSATDSRIGQTAVFRTLAHDVAGQAVIVDDCTIEIRNFVYDGGGPNVVVYVAKDLSFANALTISENLSGTPYNGGTLTVQLPENASLDDARAISIWCIDFAVNFGDGTFQ